MNSEDSSPVLPDVIDPTVAVASFKKHRPQLLSLIRHSVSSLADSLYAENIISQDSLEKAQNQYLGDSKRGRALLDCVEARLGIKPSDFKTFITVLKSDPFLIDLRSALIQSYYTVSSTSETSSSVATFPPKLAMYTKILKALYSAKPEVPLMQDSWPPVSGHTFINLALIKQEDISYAGKYARSTVQGDMDDIIKDKEGISYGSVFREFQSKSLVLIEGRPGSGKTTLVHKISQDWAKGEGILKGAKLVFLVSLRILSEKGKIGLYDILNLFFNRHQESCSILLDLEKSLNVDSGEGVCFILDGLDEYTSGNDRIISDIIKKKYLPLSMVIVASRPVATARLRNQAAAQVEVLGFMKDQIFQYIREYRFLDQTRTSDGLSAYLNQHRNILHLCYLPVHAAMVCFLYEQLGDSLPSTETEIYKCFTKLTLHRKLKCEISESELETAMEENSFKKICELAYNMTIHSKQVMYQDELSLSDTTGTDEPSLGLVTLDLTTKLYGYKDLYTFFHLTFQEFLAAWHITQQTCEEQLKVIEQYGNEDFMRVVWKFYCGLITKFENKNAPKFNQIFKSLSNDDLFKIQCAFESQQSITYDGVFKQESEGCFSFHNSYMTTLDFTAIGYVIKNAKTHPVKTLVLDKCHFGKDDVIALQKEAGSSISTIKSLHLSAGTCADEEFMSAFTLLNCLTSLEEIDLVGTELIIPEGFEPTQLCLPNLKTLVLKKSHCELKSLKILKQLFGQDFKSINVLQFPITYLRNSILQVFGLKILIHSVSQFQHVLGLQGLELDPKCIEILSDDLKTSLCTKLILINCSIDDSGAKALAGGIKHTRKLNTLNLSINKIRDEGAIALAENLKCCTELSLLDLSCNDISDDGAIAVAEALTSNEGIIDLRIWNSRISDSGINSLQSKKNVDIESLELKDDILINGYSLVRELAKIPSILYYCKSLKIKAYSNSIEAIAECLPSCNNLQTLKLLMLDICSFDDSKLFLDSLKSCENLVHLYLKGIRINVKGALAFAESLKKLQTLAFGNNSIYIRDTQYFAELFICNLLKSLNLADNQIGDNGIRTLAVALKNCVNLCTLNLSNNDICAEGAKSLASVLFHCNSLESLNLSYNRIGSDGLEAIGDSLLNLHTTGDFKGGYHLAKLNISGNNICTGGVKALASVLKYCGNCLQALRLNDNFLDASDTILLNEVLRQCSELHILDLSNNMISHDGAKSLADNLKHCPNLHTLNLGGNSIGTGGAKTLAEGLKYCSNLRTLNIYNNSIGEGVKTLVYCRLQTLDLGYNCIGSIGAEGLAVGLKNCVSLKTLKLDNNNIDDGVVVVLVTGLKYCINLQMLDISRNDIRASGAFDLANGLKDCSKLQSLILSDNYISDHGAKALSTNLKHFKDLKTLNLENNNIHSNGAKDLSDGLKYTRNLQKLNLECNGICNKGVKALCKNFKYISNLEEFNLRNNNIGSGGAIALAKSLKHVTNLQELNLNGNNIDYDCAKALAEGLKYISNLKKLHLKKNRIYTSSFMEITDGLKHMSGLQELDLDGSYNHITVNFVDAVMHSSNLLSLNLSCIDESTNDASNNLQKLNLNCMNDAIDLLANLKNLRYLEELNLSTSIGPFKKAEVFSCLLHCINLRMLLLNYNKIGDIGAKTLASCLKNCSNLQELHLAGNMIGSNGAKATLLKMGCFGTPMGGCYSTP